MIQFLQVDDEVQLEGEKPHSDLLLDRRRY